MYILCLVLEGKPVLEAATVFLLMKKGFPISRNVRAQWILEHLETVVSIQHAEVESKEAPELEIASVLPKSHPAAWSIESSDRYRYRVTKSTGIIFLAHRYRIVLCLDLSPSLGTVVSPHYHAWFKRNRPLFTLLIILLFFVL